MNPLAILFDIDGTLVDSNYAHVAAWSRALEDVGRPTPSWRIHSGIGMDSSHLLDRLLGPDADELGTRVKQLHSDYYLGSADALGPLPGARDLLKRVHSLGTRVVLATSAPEEELTILRRVLDADSCVYAVTSAEDVETAKPEPDIVAIALERAGVAASEAIFVGDSIWDVEAASRAGVRCVGVRSGGTSALELSRAGTFAVWDDPADLLLHYDETFS